MNKRFKAGGLASIGEALIYISMFVFWGAVLQFPSDADQLQKVAFLKENQIIISVMNIIGYVVFGVLLAILVQSLHQLLIKHNEGLTQLANVFGLIWVGIIITGGMVANIGLQTIIDLAATEPEQVRAVWLSNNIVKEALGGGIEIVGALWVLLITVAALKSKQLPIGLNVVGFIVGIAGVLTLYPLDIFTEIFGLGQIVWFIWLGVVLIKKSSEPLT